MTDAASSGRIEYQIQIGEFAAQQSWDEVLGRLRERVPNLSAFIEQERQLHAEFLIPRTFDLDQAMRLREVLAACGLTVSVVPAAGDPSGASESPTAPRDKLQDLIPAWSRFLGFGEFPQRLQGSEGGLLGLGFRLVAALLAVPAGAAVFPAFAPTSVGDVVIVEVVAYLMDILVLWTGIRVFAPQSTRPASMIEAAVAPTYLLHVVPVVGFFVGSVWRLGLRAQAILTALPVDGRPGRAIYAGLVPWLAFGALLTMLVAIAALIVRSGALPL